MPLYEFDVLNAQGEVLATFPLSLPIAQRDAVTLQRRMIPASIGFPGSAADPTIPSHQVLKTYQRLEARYGNNREFRRRIGHSPAVVKRAWSQE